MKRLFLITGLFLALCASGFSADLNTHNLAMVSGLGGSHTVVANRSVALRIRWKGTANSGETIAVDGSGRILFTTDGSTVDGTINNNGTTGTLDTTVASGNTWGKVAGLINASTNWACILVDVCPSWSSNGVLTTMAETTGSASEVADGTSLYMLTIMANRISACLGVEWMPDAAHTVGSGDIRNQRTTPDNTASYPTYTNELVYCRANATFTTGTTTLTIYAVRDDTDGATELTLWKQAGAATTVDCVLDFTQVYMDLAGAWELASTNATALVAPKGWRIVADYTNSINANMMTGYIQVHGLTYNE